MSTLNIRIGSRGSQLALWQANHVAAQLRAHGHATEIEVIRTSGDRLQDPGPPATVLLVDGVEDPAVAAAEGLSPNGTGIFIKEIEDALAAGKIDLAVHSLKDLPTEISPRFTLAAIPARADSRDAFVCEKFWGLHMLPLGSSIGTTSPRRRAMLLALRPDLDFAEIRGNVDTRLRKWESGSCDALVLAAAGLDRLERTVHVHQRFSVDEITPAPGQGALALETRKPASASAAELNEVALKGMGFSPSIDPASMEGALAPEDSIARDQAIYAAVRALNCADTEFAVSAERAVLHALGSGCQLPLGAFCHKVDDLWHLHALVVSLDGEQAAHVLHKAPLHTPAVELGSLVADELIARGALELLNQSLTTNH